MTLGATQAHAGSCWVDKVYLTQFGVAVRFIPGAPLRVMVMRSTLPRSGRTYDRVAGGYQEMDKDYNPVGQPVDAIPLVIGDDATLSNSPEDTCSLYAVIRHGQRGISTGAFFYDNVPGDKPQTVDDFIAAEPAP